MMFIWLPHSLRVTVWDQPLGKTGRYNYSRVVKG